MQSSQGHVSLTAATLDLVERVNQIGAVIALPQKLGPRKVAKTNLQSLLSLVRFVGKQRLTASRSRLPLFGRHILQAASRVLEDWPSNFRKLLRDTSPHTSDDGSITDSLEFEDVQRAISERFASRMQARCSVTQSEASSNSVLPA